MFLPPNEGYWRDKRQHCNDVPCFVHCRPLWEIQFNSAAFHALRTDQNRRPRWRGGQSRQSPVDEFAHNHLAEYHSRAPLWYRRPEDSRHILIFCNHNRWGPSPFHYIIQSWVHYNFIDADAKYIDWAHTFCTGLDLREILRAGEYDKFVSKQFRSVARINVFISKCTWP